MSEKRIMVVGLDGAGKSTVADLIEGAASDHRHREDCLYRSRCFEVPGRYVESAWMRNIVIMLGQNQASAAVLLLDGATLESRYSSGYARAFSVSTLGILTKASALSEDERRLGVRLLADAGCEDAIPLDARTGDGAAELMSWVAAVDPECARTHELGGLASCVS